MATGDLYRVAMSYGVAGQSNVNVYHMRQAAQIGDDSANDIAQALAPLFKQLYQPILAAPRANLMNVEVTKISRILSDQGQASAQFEGTGDNQGAALPPANAVVMRIKTGFADRTRRGRAFLGGVGINYVASGSLNEAGLTKYATFIAAFRAGFMGALPQSSMELGVFSRSRYAIISNPFDDYWKPASQLAIASAVATMRSRKVGVGA